MATRKIALFRSPLSELDIVGTEITEKYNDDYARVSDWVDVDFPPLSAEDRAAQLSRIESAKASELKYHTERLAKLNRHKAELDGLLS